LSKGALLFSQNMT